MDSRRNIDPAHRDDFDPRWWLVPAALVATTLLIALGGFVALHDTQVLASAAPARPAAPLAPETLDAPAVSRASPEEPLPQEQPPTF